jgi:hypothetical protein
VERCWANLRTKTAAVCRTKEQEVAYLTRVRAKSGATHERAGSGIFGERPRPVSMTNIRFSQPVHSARLVSNQTREKIEQNHSVLARSPTKHIRNHTSVLGGASVRQLNENYVRASFARKKSKEIMQESGIELSII